MYIAVRLTLMTLFACSEYVNHLTFPTPHSKSIPERVNVILELNNQICDELGYMSSEISMKNYTAQFMSLYISFKNHNWNTQNMTYHTILYLSAKKYSNQRSLISNRLAANHCGSFLGSKTSSGNGIWWCAVHKPTDRNSDNTWHLWSTSMH